MTAAGEILNLPVPIPMRKVVSAYYPPAKRDAARYHPPQPQRVYAIERLKQPQTVGYDADGYTRITPDKGSIIDLFA